MKREEMAESLKNTANMQYEELAEKFNNTVKPRNTLNSLLSSTKMDNIQAVDSVLKSNCILLENNPGDISPTAVQCLEIGITHPKGIVTESPNDRAITIKVVDGAMGERNWYAFHYNNGESTTNPGTVGTGSCLVPYDAPVGTVIISGGFCGCVARIDRTEKGLLFTHDNNGRCFKNPLPNSTRLATIDYSLYCKTGENFQPIKTNKSIEKFTVRAATLIFVKLNHNEIAVLCSSYFISQFSKKPEAKGFFSKIASVFEKTTTSSCNTWKEMSPDPENSGFLCKINTSPAFEYLLNCVKLIIDEKMAGAANSYREAKILLPVPLWSARMNALDDAVTQLDKYHAARKWNNRKDADEILLQIKKRLKEHDIEI